MIKVSLNASQHRMSVLKLLAEHGCNKKHPKMERLLLTIISWCTIADVKITLLDDSESDTQEICDLLDNRTNVEEPSNP